MANPKNTTIATNSAPTELTDYKARIAQRSPIVVDGIDPDSADFVMPTDPDVAKAALAEADYVAPVFIKIDEMQDMRAVYIGRGEHEFTDEKTGEVWKSPTYTFQRGKARGWIIGAYELDKAMENIPADGSHIVHIFRGKDQRVGQRNVSRYRVVANYNPQFKPSNQLPEKVG